MSATGLDVFDRTLQTTNIWLDDIMSELGPDRQVAWRSLGAVLRAVRDHVPVELSAHLGAQLPLMVRGAYYDQWQPNKVPQKVRSAEKFLERVGGDLADIRPVNPESAATAVLHALSRHADRGQLSKVRTALPEDIRRLWPEDFLKEAPGRDKQATYAG
jgi:uncharacterized protein (DUF2267 family)